MVRNEVKAGKGFRDLTTYGKYLDNLLTPEAKIRLLRQESAYKDQEIEYLKKLYRWAGMEKIMNTPAHVKYAIIHKTAQREGNLLSIKWL